MRTWIYRSIAFHPVPVTYRGASPCRSGFLFSREPARTGNRIAIRCRRSPLRGGSERASKPNPGSRVRWLCTWLFLPTSHTRTRSMSHLASFLPPSVLSAVLFLSPRTLPILLFIILFFPSIPAWYSTSVPQWGRGDVFHVPTGRRDRGSAPS